MQRFAKRKSELRRAAWACSIAFTVGCFPLAPDLRFVRDAPTPPEIADPKFRARVKTLCLMPLVTEIDLAEDDPRFVRVESLVGVAVAEAGYSVVSAQITGEVRQQVTARRGGAFDPHTGAFDAERAESIEAEVRRDLVSSHACDVMVSPTLVVVSAGLSLGRVKWDGLTDWVLGSGPMGGWIPALSLWVEVRDPSGRELYFGTGGVEVAARFKDSGVVQYQVENLPAGELLRDASAVRTGVALALSGLTGGASTARSVAMQRRDDAGRKRREREDRRSEMRGHPAPGLDDSAP